MDLERFKRMIAAGAPPPDLAPALAALWRLRQGDWPAAHRLAQDGSGPQGDWVHAHLHRVEGDLSNAAYWYRRAGRPASSQSLPEEWDEIATALLAGSARPED